MGEWSEDIKTMLDELINQLELPKGSLYLSTNKA